MLRRTVSAILAGFAATLIFLLAVLGALGVSWRAIPGIALVVAGGFLLTAGVYALGWWSLMGRRRRSSLRAAVMLGAVSGLASFSLVAWLLEGLEYGLAALLADPVSWVWLVGFCLGGSVLGWVSGHAQSRDPMAQSVR